MKVTQEPGTSQFLVFHAGDTMEVTLRVEGAQPGGTAAFRTNLGCPAITRAEIIAATETGAAPLARDWHDLAMTPQGSGEGGVQIFKVTLRLTDVGVFAGKACYFENGIPVWPDGENLRMKVAPARTACANSIYTAFVRQFGEALHHNPSNALTKSNEQELEHRGYTVIPPSGTFRDVIKQLDHILRKLRFRIVQLLPIFPTPTTFAKMGRYGSPFAALDFFSVDPALAEFDTHASPFQQFQELVDAVHSRAGFLYLDLPANHTGWAATLMTHHPDWYHHNPDGAFHSPGAWGVTWADLVELDYKNPRLRAYMADVFLFWCRTGVDGFRCDAGYMIPAETWSYIIARVRNEFPDTVFLLEGLGGPLVTTEKLLTDPNLDWAYSELFQTFDRGAFDWYLPRCLALSEKCGPLVHFAETHDNNRLAEKGIVYARMRTALSALLSQAGAWGITAGVEWYATEKIDVHGAASLSWDAEENQCALLARLNTLLAIHPCFGPGVKLRMVTTSGGPVLAVVRDGAAGRLLVLINLDASAPARVTWHPSAFVPSPHVYDLISGRMILLSSAGYELAPGETLCLTVAASDLEALDAAMHDPAFLEPPALTARRKRLMAMRVEKSVAGIGGHPWKVTHFAWPVDTRREVMVPAGNVLEIRAEYSFSAHLEGTVPASAVPDKNGYTVSIPTVGTGEAKLSLWVYTPAGIKRSVTPVLLLGTGDEPVPAFTVTGRQVREVRTLSAYLSNGAGAMARVRAAWGEIESQYDCLLAANPSPTVPVDKMLFFTRCRAWLTNAGYSQAIDKTCLASFTADPAGRFAEWAFDVPCGMGRMVPLTFRLALRHLENAATLTLTRGQSPADQKFDGAITVILRPDIEWRSNHTETKAYLGAERVFPAATTASATGFDFCPAPPAVGAFRISKGAYHGAAEWHYQVEHAEEASRGLDSEGDLWSPGWFSVPLLTGETSVLTASYQSPECPLAPVPAQKPSARRQVRGEKLVETLREAMLPFIVRRDSLLTIIAGCPWFLDWGRDTLISLRGLIASGFEKESFAILCEFARFEKDGTIPNMIRGSDDANRETADAPLWLIVAAGELADRLGVATVLKAPCGKRTLAEVLVSIVEHYQHGTPNGIQMDSESGLIWSPPHYTWMDTNYPAGTPREGYPVEIQALWIASLRNVARFVDDRYMALAEKAALSLATYFPVPLDPREGGRFLADCLRAKRGIGAAAAVPEDAIRPNQLLAVTLGALFDRQLARDVIRSCECLLIPGAIRTLADRPVAADMGIVNNGKALNDPHHPYKGRYIGDEDTSRKPAYHNGTAWPWPFPNYCEALVREYGAEAIPVAKSLLSSCRVLMGNNTLGQLPEIVDGDWPHTPRGCSAQAWSVAEFLRVAELLISPRA